jgi:tripartite-type tricarboxylate transporter receptor subunit TctC
MRCAHALPGIIVLALAASAANAQGWPSKPIRLIVAQNAGSSPDVIARLIAPPLSSALGQQVLVDNRGGGDGSIGTQQAARSPADGYTLLFGTAAAISINPYTFKSLPYDPEKDFAGVALVGKSPFILVAHPGVKAKTVPELIALAKSQPDRIAFTSPGQRSLPGMIGEVLKRRSGASILHVPANGAQGLQDTLAGRTQFTIQGIPAVSAMVQNGQLQPIALIASKRVPGMEQVPTLSETYPGLDYLGWFAVFAPAGAPNEATQRSNREIDRIVNEADVTKRLHTMGIYPEPGWTPSQVDEFARSERALWSRTVKELGIEPQ